MSNLHNFAKVDLAGVGIGAFNLSLAALLQPKPEISYVFLDSKKKFQWHQHMMLTAFS